MIFLPYKIDSPKQGLPLITVVICILCCWVYWQQYSADSQYKAAVIDFCKNQLSLHISTTLENVENFHPGNRCYEIFDEIRATENPQQTISELANNAKPLGLFETAAEDTYYLESKLLESYRTYDLFVPKALTTELAYDPKDINIVKMVTSTFSHADLFHLLGNLLFFYIFAASLELVIGHTVFLIFVLVSTFGTSLAYSYAMIGAEEALPTVGLSGVVMAALAALAIMLPGAKIRCFFWALIFVRVFRIPALILAIWYVGWDLYDMQTIGNQSYINYVAHISGAVIGGILGVYYLLFKRSTLRLASDRY